MISEATTAMKIKQAREKQRNFIENSLVVGPTNVGNATPSAMMRGGRIAECSGSG
jgi:hypothetical protein